MDFKTQKPIYLQIAERVMEQVLAGQYAEGDKLPSVREYAADVEVNMNTVARSFEWLQMRDIIAVRRGLGNFVSEGAVARVQQLRRNEFFEEQVPEFFRTMQSLGITLDEVINYNKNNK